MVLRSPSSSSFMSGFSCDVFLSFRGEDIQVSAVSLIVFSKGYAISKWCPDEVLMIMEEYDESSSTNKRREVVPVFYNIDPTDVRNQTGCFEEAFNGYDYKIRTKTDVKKKRELLDKVKAWRGSLKKAGSWRGSLKKAGSLTGIALSTFGYEAKLITNIVNVIRKKLNYNALYIGDKLVGITQNIDEIESWLQDPLPNAVIFVIDGMGGIGKTTIAKCVYNSNFRGYDCSCFLANINDASSQPNGMLRLQSQLLSTILKCEKEETVWNEYEGTTKITDIMCNKKVLLVLDDVTTSQPLNALLGPQRFYPVTKVIITTRHTSLSTAFTVHPKVQTVKTLSYHDSMKLFCLHAFYQDQPIEPYIDHLLQVLRYCDGLPLALEVLGSYLCRKRIDAWKDALCKLKSIPFHGIHKVLQLSYESLDSHDKDLFVHIACFFVWEDKDYIVKLLIECNLHPVIGTENLMDRSLLYVEHGKIGMHQLIWEMGKEVVHQESPKDPGKRSRLWQREDCINMLQENAGTKKVEGLMFDAQNIREAKKMDNPRKHGFLESNFKIGALEKMKNLMLLQLNYVTFSGKYKKLPRELRFLRWHGFSLKYIPGDIPMEKLVVT